jgi:hypothetical protein
VGYGTGSTPGASGPGRRAGGRAVTVMGRTFLRPIGRALGTVKVEDDWALRRERGGSFNVRCDPPLLQAAAPADDGSARA